MQTGSASGSTPSLGAALGLLLIVLVLFLVGGLLVASTGVGEAGILVSQLGFLFLPAVLFVRLGGFDPIRTLSLTLPTGRQAVGGIVALIGGVQIAWFLAWIQGLFMPVPIEFLEAMSEMLQADSIGRYLWLLVLAALVPAVAEETLFRGVLLSGFRNQFSTVGAVVGVGLVFGLFHLSPQTAFRFLPTAWLGILLAWVVVASGSLPLSIGLHFLNNAAILTATALPQTRELVGPEDAPPLVLLPIAIVLLIWGVRWIGRTEIGERTPMEAETSGSSP